MLFLSLRDCQEEGRSSNHTPGVITYADRVFSARHCSLPNLEVNWWTKTIDMPRELRSLGPSCQAEVGSLQDALSRILLYEPLEKLLRALSSYRHGRTLL